MTLATAYIAAPLGLLIAGLGLAISRRRIKGTVGDAGTPRFEAFQRLQRAHGNATEHVPILLFLLLLLEMQGARRELVLGVGAVLVLARMAHAAGIVIRRRHILQFSGAALTYTLEIVLPVLLLVSW